MSLRELDVSTTAQSGSPLTRREARELEARSTPTPAKPSSAGRLPMKKKTVKPRPPRASIRGPRKVESTQKSASKLLSIGALLFAGALLIGSSVPANAFMTDASSIIPDTPVNRMPGQTMAVSADAQMAATTRDTFDVISYADQLRLKYGNVSYSFTATTGAIRWPFPYSVPITDGFGDRPAGTSGTSHHNGVDFVPGQGTPIYAVADGVVSVHSDDAGGYGNHVIISHDVNGNSFDSLYAHMLTGSSPLNAGDAIAAGDFIGLVGDTGDSYGAHLHFEIRIGNIPVDPFAWLQANAVN